MLLDYIFRHEGAIILANKLGVAGGLFVVKRIQYLLWNLLINRTYYVKCQLVTSIFGGSTHSEERKDDKLHKHCKHSLILSIGETPPTQDNVIHSGKYHSEVVMEEADFRC